MTRSDGFSGVVPDRRGARRHEDSSDGFSGVVPDRRGARRHEDVLLERVERLCQMLNAESALPYSHDREPWVARRAMVLHVAWKADLVTFVSDLTDQWYVYDLNPQDLTRPVAQLNYSTERDPDEPWWARTELDLPLRR